MLVFLFLTITQFFHFFFGDRMMKFNFLWHTVVYQYFFHIKFYFSIKFLCNVNLIFLGSLMIIKLPAKMKGLIILSLWFSVCFFYSSVFHFQHGWTLFEFSKCLALLHLLFSWCPWSRSLPSEIPSLKIE